MAKGLPLDSLSSSKRDYQDKGKFAAISGRMTREDYNKKQQALRNSFDDVRQGAKKKIVTSSSSSKTSTSSSTSKSSKSGEFKMKSNYATSFSKKTHSNSKFSGIVSTKR